MDSEKTKTEKKCEAELHLFVDVDLTKVALEPNLLDKNPLLALVKEKLSEVPKDEIVGVNTGQVHVQLTLGYDLEAGIKSFAVPFLLQNMSEVTRYFPKLTFAFGADAFMAAHDHSKLTSL